MGATSQLLAFKLSKPIEVTDVKAEWRGTGRAVAGWYCTGPLGWCGYCRAYYNGSSMTCDEWACGGCCKSCDMT